MKRVLLDENLPKRFARELGNQTSTVHGLVEDLWDSIAADPEELPLTEAQKAELDRRLEEHKADRASAIPWAEVRERLYKKYG